jgi:hypothetical protein
MVLKEDCLQVGDKYYLAEDVQRVFEARIPEVTPEDINPEQQ